MFPWVLNVECLCVSPFETKLFPQYFPLGFVQLVHTEHLWNGLNFKKKSNSQGTGMSLW